jgi:glycosyltransferase involved in cell wall biosynthesis
MPLRKIAYLTPLYFDETSCLGGGERYPLNLARGVVLASEGTCSVELVSYGAEPLRRSLGPGLSLRVLRAANRPANPIDVVSWELASVIAEADLLHIHSAFCRSCEMALLLARQQRKPVCVTDHGGFSSSLGLHLGHLDLADKIISNSAFGASLYYWKGRPVEVILGGVDDAVFTPPAPGTRPPRDRVLFVGRLLPHKGVEHLIAAMPAGLPLTVCGRPYDPGHHRNLLWRAAGAGKQVEFITDADDRAILDLYRRAWVNVLPSVYQDSYGDTYVAPELMGFALLEAMACGTPVICSRVGGMPEYVRDGETGFIFDTPQELTDRLRLLAGDPALCDRMGAQARRVIEEEFSLKVAGRKTLEVYRGLIDRAGEAAA